MFFCAWNLIICLLYTSYVQIESDMSKDYVALDDFTGISGHRYVAAYFMDGWSREVVNLSRRGIAATTYFDTVES